MVLFKMLKNSARNWAVSRSFTLKLLNNLRLARDLAGNSIGLGIEFPLHLAGVWVKEGFRECEKATWLRSACSSYSQLHY